MRNAIFFILPLLFSACIIESSLHPNFPAEILHGNSAKVWILNYSSDKNDIHISSLDEYRKTFTFFANRNFKEQELIYLGSKNGKTGQFSIKKDENENFVLVLKYKNDQIHYYQIKEISNNFLSLEKIEKNKTTWNFSTLQEI